MILFIYDENKISKKNIDFLLKDDNSNFDLIEIKNFSNIEKKYSHYKFIDKNEFYDSETVEIFVNILENVKENIRIFSESKNLCKNFKMKRDSYDHINPYLFLWNNKYVQSIFEVVNNKDLFKYFEIITKAIELGEISTIYKSILKRDDNPTLYFEIINKIRDFEIIEILKKTEKYDKWIRSFVFFELQIIDYTKYGNLNETRKILKSNKFFKEKFSSFSYHSIILDAESRKWNIFENENSHLL